jgi:hypothetical protein
MPLRPLTFRFVGKTEDYPETGFWEIDNDFLEADFWPGTASG